jgi:hypothetical protein
MVDGQMQASFCAQQDGGLFICVHAISAVHGQAPDDFRNGEP